MEIALNIIACLGAVVVIIALAGLIVALTDLVKYLIKVIRIYLVGDYDNSEKNNTGESKNEKIHYKNR